MSADLKHVTISVATFRRTASLEKLLDSIVSATRPAGVEIHCIIVDNDPDQSARPVVDGFHHRLSISYAHEPTPGIVAARNRGLDNVGSTDAIVFVDDDEVVGEDWIAELIRAAMTWDADVVTGPVTSVLPEGATDRQRRLLPFLQRNPLPDGHALHVAATNNTLLRHSSWKRMGYPRFDEAFSFTGGSDSAFFTRGHIFGWSIRHAAGARVYEEVPPDRLTFKWVRRRFIRVGNVLYRVRRIRGKRFPAAGAAAKYIGYGVLNAPIESIRRRGIPYRSISKFYTGVGVLTAMMGNRVQEYRRPE